MKSILLSIYTGFMFAVGLAFMANFYAEGSELLGISPYYPVVVAGCLLASILLAINSKAVRGNPALFVLYPAAFLLIMTAGITEAMKTADEVGDLPGLLDIKIGEVLRVAPHVLAYALPVVAVIMQVLNALEGREKKGAA